MFKLVYRIWKKIHVHVYEYDELFGWLKCDCGSEKKIIL